MRINGVARASTIERRSSDRGGSPIAALIDINACASSAFRLQPDGHPRVASVRKPVAPQGRLD
jgi:hypothetical protein